MKAQTSHVSELYLFEGTRGSEPIMTGYKNHLQTSAQREPFLLSSSESDSYSISIILSNEGRFLHYLSVELSDKKALDTTLEES